MNLLQSSSRRRQISVLLRYIVALTMLFNSPAGLLANPTGGNVVAGSATISGGPGTLNVNQSTDRAVINWQGFSIGAGETTNFNLPSSSSAVLNRVVGGNPSAIYGNLNSNGQVWLVNPNGILIGPGAQINVGSLVASSLNVPDAQFMEGREMHFQGDTRAGVTNFGTIRAIEGDVYLIGANVANHGLIEAKYGTVGLAAGQSVTLVDSAHPHLTVRATEASLDGTGVHNTGAIVAIQAELIANGGNVYGLAINHEGNIRATGSKTIGGRVFLVAEDGGTIHSSGDIVAKRGTDGGDVFIHAGGQPGSVAIVSGVVDVSGDEVGGNILVKAEKIDVGDATFITDGKQPGNLFISLGPHSVNQVPEGTGGFLSWTGQTGLSITDNGTLLTATSSDNVQLTGFGTNIARTDSSAFDGVMLESADPSNPFLGFITVNLDKQGGSVPNGTEAKFTFDVLEPDGSMVQQELIVASGGNTKFTFQADGGELIMKITITSSSTGYDNNGDPNPGGVPVFNRLKQIKDVEIAAGAIIVEKQTLPDGSNEDFAFTINDSDDALVKIFQLMDGGQDVSVLVADTYAITEVLTAQQIIDGWILTDITLGGDTDGGDSVSVPDATATVKLDGGEVITVTFENTQGGRIVVRKEVADGSDTSTLFGFDASYIDGTPPDFQLADGDFDNSGVLLPGEYTVEELTLPEGWFFDEITGDTSSVDGMTATVEVVAGQTAEIVFHNTQGGQVKVTKSVAEGSDTSTLFDFDASYIEGTPPDFQLSDGQMEASVYLRPGEYTVEEINLPEGWFFDEITGDTSSVNGMEATVMVTSGNTESIVFHNTQGGQVKVTKSVAEGSDTSTLFDFDASYIDGTPPDFQLADGQMDTSVYLRPGEYTVEEINLPEGWFFDEITGDTSSINGMEATVMVTSGNTESIVFHNTQGGQVKVTKSVAEGSDTSTLFDFDASYIDGTPPDFQLADGQMDTSVYLRPGEYTVEEINLPEGWFFDEITGDTSSTNGMEATVQVTSGNTESIVFHNTQGGQVKVTKSVAEGSDTSTLFDFDASYIDGTPPDFQLSDGQMDTSVYLRPGEYTVEEINLPEGWFFDEITGDTSSVNGMEATVMVTSGNTESIVFHNTQGGQVKVTKSVAEGSDTSTLFAFDASYVDGTPPDFQLSDGQMDTSVYLRPGEYTVEEINLPEGWFFDEITGDTSSVNGMEATVMVTSGNTESIVFHNTQGGQVKVTKSVAEGSDTSTLFDFDASYIDGTPPDFQLADGQMDTSVYLRPGEYTVEEINLPEGWFFDEITGDTSSTNGMEATVQVTSGNTESIVFHNTQGGQVKVTKSVAEGSDTSTLFDFDASYIEGSPDFQLADGQMDTSVYLRPGEYTVEEINLPEGWFFDEITGDTSSVNGMEATVQVTSGNTESIVFHNTQGGQVKVTKSVTEGSDTSTLFDFDASYIEGSPDFQLSDGQMDTSVYLRPGEYTVEEINLPEGWFFDEITGDTSSVNGMQATVQVTSGNTESIVFHNTQGGKIFVTKFVLTDGQQEQLFGFDASYISGELPDFELADGQTHMSLYLRPGEYSVSELPLPNWILENIMLIDRNSEQMLNPNLGNGESFALDPGQSLELFFKNRFAPPVDPLFFKWDPIYPEGIGDGTSGYGEGEEGDESDIAGGSSFDLFGE